MFICTNAAHYHTKQNLPHMLRTSSSNPYASKRDEGNADEFTKAQD